MPTAAPSSRRGSRRGVRARRGLSPAAAGLLMGALAALVAWGALAWTGIQFGRSARGGDTGDWGWLLVASLGAVACLFGALALATAALRRVGVLDTREPHRH